MSSKTCWQSLLAVLLLSSALLVCMMVAIRRSSAASALSEPPAIAPALEGSVPVVRGVSGSKIMDSAWYLGGFCFGHGSIGVGRITLELQKEGVPTSVWNSTGSLWLALYDDEDSHWGAALESWASNSCHDKLQSANSARYIAFPRHLDSVQVNMTIRQAFERHWHVALVGCGLGVQDPGYSQTLLHYKILQWNSLWTFYADNWRPAACSFNPANLLQSINVHEFLSV